MFYFGLGFGFMVGGAIGFIIAVFLLANKK